MNEVISFTKEKRKREGFNEGDTIPLELYDIEISALNFISEYLGIYPTNNMNTVEHIQRGIIKAVELGTHHLETEGKLIIHPSDSFFNWTIKHRNINTWETNTTLLGGSTRLFNEYVSKYKNHPEYDETEILPHLINTYISSFLKFLHGKESPANFTPLEIAIEKARKNDKTKMLEMLLKLETQKDQSLIILPIVDQELWKAGLISDPNFYSN